MNSVQEVQEVNNFKHYLNPSLFLDGCPKYQVQVRRVVRERIIKRCENHCPLHHISIRGICRDLKHTTDFTMEFKLADLLNQEINEHKKNKTSNKHSTAIN